MMLKCEICILLKNSLASFLIYSSPWNMGWFVWVQEVKTSLKESKLRVLQPNLSSELYSLNKFKEHREIHAYSKSLLQTWACTDISELGKYSNYLSIIWTRHWQTFLQRARE